MQANIQSIDIAATLMGKPTTMTTNSNHKSRNKTNHKSSTSSSSSTSTPIDQESAISKLLASLVKSSKNVNNNINNNSTNNNTNSSTSTSNNINRGQEQNSSDSNENVALRFLETWHDDSGKHLDDNCYQELVDPSNSNGWSADDMFKYNERMHKVTSSYNEKTLADKYTTPLPRNHSKTTARLAAQLAKEIEDKVLAEGRITPESSDDDELFETERIRRVQVLKQQRQLDQLRNQKSHSHHRFSNNQSQLANNVASCGNTKTSSQYSNSTATPATASLSSSPTLNDSTIKPVTSSSRNILRACLI